MNLIPTPIPALKIFDVFPGYVYAAALALTIVGLGGALGVQTVRLADANTTIATQKADAEALRADRALAARRYEEKARLDERAHALHQQEIVDAYAAKLKTAETRRVADVARAERVRGNAESAAARDRAESRSDHVACQRVADRNAILYGMVSEGFNLVIESRGILETRDAAIETLKGVIANDRTAICGGAP